MPHILIKSVGIALATAGAVVIDEKTHVPIAAVVTIAAAWGSALWWLGRKLQTLEDGLKTALDDRAEAKKIMAALVEKVAALRCQVCPVEFMPKAAMDKPEES